MSSQMTRTDFKTTEDTSRVSATHRREERRVISDGQVERVELEERDQEEYYYVESRDDIPPRRRFADGSESVTMNFSTDDRLLGNTDRFSSTSHFGGERRFDELRRADDRQRQSRFEELRRDSRFRDTRREHDVLIEEEEEDDGDIEEVEEYKEERNQRYQRRGVPMSVDYTPTDFRQSLSTMEAASREGVRVRHQGDTTILTEHRDPYSFYWQLDQARKQQDEPRRRPPPTDYVIDEETVADTVLSPDSHDSGINVESQYSKPMRIEEPPPMKPLPPGWEKHQDPSGYSYYWHVDSGTIQREPPVQNREIQVDTLPSPIPAPPPVQQQIIQLPAQQPVIEEHAFKQTTTKRRIDNDALTDDDDDFVGKPVRFAVRSLGWTEIAEEDLTAEKSSRAVNKAIVDLSTGRNDIMDNVSKWGDGRELIMELDDNDLTLIDPDTMAVVHSERIQQIRVWGVGRDNGRDFAYVARDRNSRRFMCHVFRCDTPARTIANTLRDICKRLMLQRRPNTLNSMEHRTERRVVARDSSLPTPIEEPKKTLRCHFLGVTQVPRATGIEILNEAVDRLVSQVRQERWILADVSIAPSTITISEVNGNQIAECRVRYLSFLGIGRDIKHCAFIMHTSSENFMCYVFHVEPNAGAMAKTIEAACKLRYQKVLDAHASARTPPNGKGWGESLWGAFGSMRERFSSSSR